MKFGAMFLLSYPEGRNQAEVYREAVEQIRLAEEAAMVDILSGGRLDFGVGRGYQWNEFRGFNLSMEESRDRFDESLEIIKQSWTGERLTFQGKHFQYQ